MNNIQKSFAKKAQSGLRNSFADGGVPKETPDQLMARISAKYGAPAAGPVQQAPVVQAPAPQPVQAPAPAQKPGFFGGLRKALDPRTREARVESYGHGGEPVGLDEKGYIHGPKGDDKVPARVAETGEEIRVGAGERIVNPEQNAALEKLAASHGMGLDEYLESATGKPVGPTMKQGLRGAVLGGEFGTPVKPSELQPWARDPVQTMELAEPTGKGAAGRAAAMANQSKAAMNAMPTQPNMGPQPAPVETGGFDAEVRARAAANRAAGATSAAPAVSKPALSRPELFGRELAASVKRSAPDFKALGGKALGVAATGLAAYDAHKTAASHDDFYSDPNVGFLDKGLQAGRDVYRAAMPLVGGAIGLGAGTVASPTLVANPVTGALAGTAAGVVAGGLVDAEGDALKKYREAHPVSVEDKASQKNRAAHDAIVNGDSRGTITLPTLDKAAAQKATAESLRLAEPASPEGMKAGFRVGAAQTARANDLDASILGQGAKTGRADFMGEKDATEYALPAGSTGGFVTRSPNKQGLRSTTYLSGEASEADKRRDAEFEAKGYGKDAYGNWVTPQQQADKQALARITRERAEFNAFDPSITDPNARNAGLAAVALKYGPEDKLAAEAAAKKADRDITIRGQNITLRGQENMQANNERDFRASQSDKVNKRVDQLLETHVPTAGLKDDDLKNAQSRRADLQQAMYSLFGQNMPQDDATLNKAMPQMVEQAKTSLAIRDAIKNRGLWNRIANAGTDPWTTLHGAKIDLDGKNIRFQNGFTIPVADVIKDGTAYNADILAALKARTTSN